MNATHTAILSLVAYGLVSPSPQALFAQSKPAPIGEIRNIGQPLSTIVGSVAANGRYAWVGTSDGLFIYDVSTPATPTYVGRERSPQPGPINRVVLSGSYVYLANVGLRIVDASNPEKPETVSYIDQGNNGTNGLAMDLALDGQYLYLANGADGLRVYDVSDVHSPTNIGHWPNPNADLGSYRMGIAVQGNYAYLAAYNDGLRIFDVSNPRNPQPVGFAPDGLATKLAVRGKRLYMVSDALSVYDISNPATPVLLSKTSDAPNPVGVAVNGNFLYVASSGFTYFGPYFYDGSDDAHPLRLAPKTDAPSAQGVWDMSMDGDRAYMVLDFGVGIYGLGAATAPRVGIEQKDGRSAVLSWPAPSFSFVPQMSLEPEGNNWTTLADAEVTTTNGVNRVVVPTEKNMGFYRLIQQ